MITVGGKVWVIVAYDRFVSTAHVRVIRSLNGLISSSDITVSRNSLIKSVLVTVIYTGLKDASVDFHPTEI